MKKCERFDANQIVQYNSRGAVVRSIMESSHRIIRLHTKVESLLHQSFSLFVQRTNWFSEVTIYFGVVQIQAIRFIICQDPRKDWILRKIIICSARKSVKLHQVIEIGDFALSPLGGVQLSECQPFSAGDYKNARFKEGDVFHCLLHLISSGKGKKDALVL